MERAVETVEARLTLTAQTSQIQSVTPSPTITPTPQQVSTELVTTSIATPYSSCDQADYLGDVTPTSKLVFSPGEVFRKVIRLQNVGACTWTPDYTLVMTEGDFQGATLVLMPSYVRPGQTIDLTFPLVAPAQPGNYISYWLLKNAKGELFGIGPNGDTSIALQVVVVAEGSLPTYDFSSNYCQADWYTGTGSISCLGSDLPENGGVYFLPYALTESGIATGPGIWVHPNEDEDGWISGRYPPVLIQSGDYFKTTLSCSTEEYGCNVLFQVEIETAGGAVQRLGQWRQLYDGRLTTVNIDLTRYTGQFLKFILTMVVQNNQPEDAYGVWVYPRIEP